MYNSNMPLPAYSLADLFKDILNGKRSDFKYEKEDFTATQSGNQWIITRVSTGHTAICSGGVNCATDLHGVAAYLQYEKRNLNFDRDGNMVIPVK